MKVEFKHDPVMLREVIDGLNVKENGTYIDATVGGAGHSIEIAKLLNADGLSDRNRPRPRSVEGCS